MRSRILNLAIVFAVLMSLFGFAGTALAAGEVTAIAIESVENAYLGYQYTSFNVEVRNNTASRVTEQFDVYIQAPDRSYQVYSRFVDIASGQTALTSPVFFESWQVAQFTIYVKHASGKMEFVGYINVVEQPQNDVDIWIPNTSMTLGTQVTLPVLVSDTTGKGILSYQFVVRYHTETFDVVQTPVSVLIAGMLSESFTVSVDYSELGFVKIAAFGTNPLVGEGALIKLNFRPKAVDMIGMMLENAMFNAGTPKAVATSGTMTIDPIEVIGHIWYAQANQNPVQGVRFEMDGPSPDWTRSDSAGYFINLVKATGDYKLIPSDDGNIQYVEQITAEDAGAILGIVFQEISGNVLRVADVDNDGKVTAFDAALTARYVVGLADIASLVGKWIFDPEMRTLNVQQSIEGQDFIAFVKGDLTALEPQVRSSAGQPEISFEAETSGIRLKVTGQHSRGYLAKFSFDSACTFVFPSESHGMSTIFNDKAPGSVRIAAFRADAGELNLFSSFYVTDECVVTLESIQIGNEPEITVDKTVTLSMPVVKINVFLPTVSR